jgi:DNA processing protein
MARGIDTHAHEAALAEGLPTIAILGCGIRRTYPPENQRLRRRILEAGGLVLSEFDPDVQAHPGCFIQRNRLIAGYSKATWIVQSGYRSGALNTAKWAREHHRNVYATPAFPGDPAFLGNLALFTEKQGKPVWDAGAFTDDWMSLFSAIETNRREAKGEGPLDLFLEIERGYRNGRDLFAILEERQLRTGEPISTMAARIEAHIPKRD